MVAVGDAAGLTKPTTGGGIFYSLLSGALAAETLVAALRRDQLGESSLLAYERQWKARLDPHLSVSSYLRRLYIKLSATRRSRRWSPPSPPTTCQQEIRRTAHFNWHGGLIRSLLRQSGIKSILFRALLR